MEINSINKIYTAYRKLQRKAELCARMGIVRLADCRITTSNGEEVEGYIRIYGEQNATAIVSWQFNCTAQAERYEYDNEGAAEVNAYLEDKLESCWEITGRFLDLVDEFYTEG